jgi:hypothetical protein
VLVEAERLETVCLDFPFLLKGIALEGLGVCKWEKDIFLSICIDELIADIVAF